MLSYVADLIKKTGIVFKGFTKDRILACPNKCAQNRYSDIDNSLYQPLAFFLAQGFVYSIESIGEIITGYYILTSAYEVTNKILSLGKLCCRCDPVTKVQ